MRASDSQRDAELILLEMVNGNKDGGDGRANTEYLLGVSYRWGSPEWLDMRKQLMAQIDSKASRTCRQRGLYKFLKNTGLEWLF